MDFYGSKDKGLFVQAAYKLALDETMFIQPQVAFGTDLDATAPLAIGVLFGWGDTNKDPIKYMNKKVSNGFSVATKLDLKAGDNMTIPLCVAAYDSTFVENLKAGVEFHIANLKADDLAFDLAFDSNYNLGVVSPTFAVKFSKAAANALKIYAACDYTGIANTTFTLGYESGNIIKENDAQLGQLWVSAKVSF
jgi:hypothetical protein